VTFRPCAIVPTYDNPRTVRSVVERLRESITDIIVVDDGSGPEGQAVCEAIGRDGLAQMIRHPMNRHKGAAVKTGFAAARAQGFTHALQVDADGQHNLEDVPLFLEAARAQPDAVILGAPIFDESIPRGRLYGRKITLFWTAVETGGWVIQDSMCGFRVYPLEASMRVASGDAMEFDIEIAVRLLWAGTPVVNIPTKVRYIPKEEGGVSHFRMFTDNARISWMHTRLMLERIGRGLLTPFRRRPSLSLPRQR